MEVPAQGFVRFGAFEVDPAHGQLLKRGRKVRLQEQPFRILWLLLRRPGEVVTREELQAALWPAGTFIEFEHGVNTAVKKLRHALGDSADHPRFIETLPRKGYRFIAPVAPRDATAAAPALPFGPSMKWAVVTLAGAIAGAAIWMTARVSTKPESMPEAVLLTGSLGTKAEPSFSPDGNSVAFAWDGPQRNNTDIYVMQIGASEPVRLTSDPAVERAPAWSPDGRCIAFVREPSGSRAGVFVIPSAGGTANRIADIAGTSLDHPWPARPSWHPGGRWLVLADRVAEGAPAALFALSIQSGEKRRLTSPPQNTPGDTWPAVSPDGRTVVFVRAHALYRRDLFALELSNDLQPVGDAKRITYTKPYNTKPAWLPDGKSIVYVSGVSPHHPSLWEMSFTDLAAAPRPLPLADADWPTISRQGRLVYGSKPWDFDIWRCALGGSGRKERMPMNSTRLDHTPQYSPDGSKIAFASDRSGGHEIWVCGANGSHAVKLTSFGGPYLAQPVWSPDGSRLAFAVRFGADDEIYLVDPEGGRPQHLVRGQGPTWSRDGRWIYFGSTRGGTQQVWKILVSGDAPVQVTKAGGEWALESADGRFIYYRLKGAVWRARADGSHETRVIPAFYPQDFEVVERGIYFTSASEPYAILFFNFRTGRTEKIADYGDPGGNPVSSTAGWGLSVSPDRQWILFTRREDRPIDLMLVENFE